jgi:hypothetical protein
MHIHGSTWKKAKQKPCERVLQQTYDLYMTPPPILHSRFPSI